MRGSYTSFKGTNLTVVEGICPVSRTASEEKAECLKGWREGEGDFQQLYVA